MGTFHGRILGGMLALVVSSVGCGRVGFDTVDAADAPETYRDAVLADLPLGYWRLGDTGTVARDETGRADGVYQGNCRHGAGALVGDGDPATQFDGRTCNVSLGDQFAFPGTAPFSIELWVSSLPTVSYLAMKETRTPTDLPVDGYGLILMDDRVYGERVVGGAIETTSRVAVAASFTHVAFVYDGQALAIYVDGTPAGSTSDARPLNVYTARLEIGGVTMPDFGFFLGGLDEVAVYDHVVPAARLQRHRDLGVLGPQ